MTAPSDAYVISPIPLKGRLIKSLSIGIPLIGLSVWAWAEQAQHGVFTQNFWFPLILFIPGCYYPWKILKTTEAKELTGVWTEVPVTKGAWKRTIIASVIALYAALMILAAADSSGLPISTRLLFPVPVFVLLGIFISQQFKPAKDFAPSPAAEEEMARLEAEKAEKAAWYQAKEAEIMQKWWFRYGASTVELLLAWWIYEQKPHLWFVSVGLLLMAIVSAKELTMLGLKLAGIALLVGLVIFAFQGIASMTVPVAIIVGAIIIAFAISSKT